MNKILNVNSTEYYENKKSISSYKYYIKYFDERTEAYIDKSDPRIGPIRRTRKVVDTFEKEVDAETYSKSNHKSRKVRTKGGEVVYDKFIKLDKRISRYKFDDIKNLSIKQLNNKIKTVKSYKKYAKQMYDILIDQKQRTRNRDMTKHLDQFIYDHFGKDSTKEKANLLLKLYEKQVKENVQELNEAKNDLIELELKIKQLEG